MPGPTPVARILLVEDHADSATAIAHLLCRFGHQVHVAGTYADAVAAAQSRGFDLLVCDIGLPDGDGCELLAEVRAMHALPAIALTGYGMLDDVARCREAGFAEHLLKPVDARKLKGAIERTVTAPTLPDLPTGLADMRPLP